MPDWKIWDIDEVISLSSDAASNEVKEASITQEKLDTIRRFALYCVEDENWTFAQGDDYHSLDRDSDIDPYIEAIQSDWRESIELRYREALERIEYNKAWELDDVPPSAHLAT